MRVALAVLAALAWAAALPAQEGACELELISAGRELRSRQVGRAYHQFAGGGVRARCLGRDMTMRADSVAWYSDRGQVDFVGGVRFRDSTVQLDSDHATYFTADERLEAFGRVRLEDLRNRSVLSGPNLTYYRPARGIRDTASMLATARPTVEYRSGRDTAAAPYVIHAERVRLVGEKIAFAGGAVEIEREEFVARADSAALDSGRGVGSLIGAARILSRDSSGYTLSGVRIEYRLSDNRLTWLQAQDSARAESGEWAVVGDTIEFAVANDRIQRGFAWGRAVRPEAVSARHVIVADSLAFDTPDQVLTEVRGFGAGMASSRRDSLGAEPDWLAGDTLVARFDTTEGGARALRALSAVGNARAYYHILPATADSLAEPGINYARGRRILVLFAGDRLERVDIVEAADGVYLEPRRVRRP